ncbi:MAG: single-stranded DNA-binding protein [Bacteroidota bacterium]
MINRVILIGNLGRDPEVRRLDNGVAVAKFSVATNENYKDKAGEWQTQTEWHDVVCWRQLAERAERDLKKGKLVYVDGKLTHRKYQDKEGNDRYITEVVANTFRLLEKKERTTNFPEMESAPEPVNSIPDKESEVTSVGDGGGSAADDDLPF